MRAGRQLRHHLISSSRGGEVGGNGVHLRTRAGWLDVCIHPAGNEPCAERWQCLHCTLSAVKRSKGEHAHLHAVLCAQLLSECLQLVSGARHQH